MGRHDSWPGWLNLTTIPKYAIECGAPWGTTRYEFQGLHEYNMSVIAIGHSGMKASAGK